MSLLFLLFAYENHDAIQVATRQRLATVEAIKQSNAEPVAAGSKSVRDLLEPTLKPATPGSVSTTHLVSDLLTVAGLWVMELRRRKQPGVSLLEQLIRIHIHRDEDVFGERQLVERLANEAAEAHDRFAAEENVETELALQFLQRRGCGRAAG